MDLYGNFAAYQTLVQKLRLHSLVFLVPFWNAFFATQCRKSIESCNNRCILGYVWIASIVRVMREWFPYNRLQIFTIAPIVRIELEAIQAIVIVPIVPGPSSGSSQSSVLCFHMIVAIAWSYFETTGTIGTIIWKPAFKQNHDGNGNENVV